MAISADQVAAAAALVSSAPKTFSRGAGGVQQRAEAWEIVRQQIARTIISDPDIVLYMVYLFTNQANARVVRVASILAEMIPLIEGRKYESTSPSGKSTRKMVKAYERAAARPFVDEGEIRALAREADSFIGRELAPTLVVRGRVQPKREESTAKYGGAKSRLLREWDQLLPVLKALSRGLRVNLPALREAAVELPMTNLGKTLETGFSQEKATEFTVQVGASVAAVRAMARPVDFQARLIVDGSSTFPEGVTINVSESGGAVGALEASVPADELGIKVGDTVTWGSQSSTVASIDGGKVTLADDGITSQAGRLSVVPSAALLLADLQKAIAAGVAGLPTSKQLRLDLARLEEGRAADIRDAIAYCAKLHAKLVSFPVSLQPVLDRVGVPSPQESPISEALVAYDPLFGRATVRAADRLLDSLEDDGMDYAAHLLLQANIAYLFSLKYDQTSRQGVLGQATSALSEYVGGGATGLGRGINELG